MLFILRWLLSAVAIIIISYILPGIGVATFWTALIVALVLGIINAILKPILIILTLPITILTLGLFTFVINALLVILTASIVKGFTVEGFWTAVLFSIILSIFNFLMSKMASDKN